MSVRTLLVACARPLLWLVFGLAVAGREHLPREGPAIVAANHNSHLDVVLLLSLFAPDALGRVRPLAAADYFLSSRALRFIALRLIGVLPLERTASRQSGDVFAAARQALAEGGILVVFPEGTRGRPEEMGALKAGVAKLARDAEAPIVPVYLQGAGRILPKGARVPVPFAVTALVGEPLAPGSDRAALMRALEASFTRLRAAAPPLHWH